MIHLHDFTRWYGHLDYGIEPVWQTPAFGATFNQIFVLLSYGFTVLENGLSFALETVGHFFAENLQVVHVISLFVIGKSGRYLATNAV